MVGNSILLFKLKDTQICTLQESKLTVITPLSQNYPEKSLCNIPNSDIEVTREQYKTQINELSK